MQDPRFEDADEEESEEWYGFYSSSLIARRWRWADIFNCSTNAQDFYNC
jgi:hypothetical protein